MGIFRMYTGADGTSVIEELRQDDPILETLKTCTGCALQVNEPSEFSDFHPAPERRWMTMISGQIDIQLADGTIYSFGPEDLRLWEDVTGQGHRTRFGAFGQHLHAPPRLRRGRWWYGQAMAWTSAPTMPRTRRGAPLTRSRHAHTIRDGPSPAMHAVRIPPSTLAPHEPPRAEGRHRRSNIDNTRSIDDLHRRKIRHPLKLRTNGSRGSPPSPLPHAPSRATSF